MTLSCLVVVILFVCFVCFVSFFCCGCFVCIFSLCDFSLLLNFSFQSTVFNKGNIEGTNSWRGGGGGRGCLRFL